MQAGIAKLIQPAVKKTRTTFDTFASQFDKVFDGAMGSAQFGVAGSAVAAQAKLHGFMRGRLELGPPGSFDARKSLQEVAIKTLEQLDPG